MPLKPARPAPRRVALHVCLQQSVLQSILRPVSLQKLREPLDVIRRSPLGIEELQTEVHITPLPLDAIHWTSLLRSGDPAREVVVDVEVLYAVLVRVVFEG